MQDAKPITILQFGATGQLARALQRAASAQDGVRLHVLARQDADFRRPEQVRDAVLGSGAIDLVVNATAYTAVDKAESEEVVAQAVNAESVGALAQACHARGIGLVHVSTDYVFDGLKAAPYREDDPVHPLGAYGRSKRDGEQAIRAALAAHAILRTSWIYSADGTNFVKTMLRLGAERDELRIVDDQHGAPTSTASLAQAVLAVARAMLRDPAPARFGTFHYADRGEVTWRGFAEAIFAQCAASAGIKARVVPIASADYPTAARRPLNSRLDCTKIERVYGIARPRWQDSLALVLDEIGIARREGRT
ncbi:MAG: dTDP-4-dehydrorhamnose reductase [Rhizomicrobium sp.]